MVVLFSLLAKSVSVDRFTNALSVFGVLDSIDATQFPLFLGEATYLATLYKQPAEPTNFLAKLSIHVGELVVSQNTVKIDFGKANTARVVVNFMGLPILRPENVKIELVMPGHDPHVLEIPVSQVGQLTPPLPFASQQS